MAMTTPHSNDSGTMLNKDALDRDNSATALPADTDVNQRRLLRKLDWHILPLLGILYAFALIDRTNLGVARIAGMDRDLKLSIGDRYSFISAIYFVPYMIFQLPSNLYLRAFGVRKWLAFCVFAWGLVQLAMGFVSSWGLLAFCRVLLGAFEAGFFPALVFVITTWYKRHEVQKRLGIFYLVSLVAGGFSAILAYVFSRLDGAQGIAGWAWIFIIEGAMTMAFGLLAWFCMPEFPDQNGFLTPAQTSFVLERIERDRGDSMPDNLRARKILKHMCDWKVWAFAMMYMCATMPAYALGFFITIILRSMGWSIADSLLLSAPPYIFAAISVWFFSWLSDRYCHRGLFIAIQSLITIIGLVFVGFVPQPSWRYFGIFLSIAGSAGCIPAILAYSSNNILTQSKRAVTTAMVTSFGGIGGIFSTLVFRQIDFPRYLPGIYATIGCQLLLLLTLGCTTLYFWVSNRRSLKTMHPVEGRAGFLYTL